MLSTDEVATAADETMCNGVCLRNPKAVAALIVPGAGIG